MSQNLTEQPVTTKGDKLAIVGNQRWSDWLAKSAQPLYAQHSRHFPEEELDAAWEWLRA